MAGMMMEEDAFDDFGGFGSSREKSEINDRYGCESVRSEVYRCRGTGEQNGARMPRFVARALPGGVVRVS